MERAGVHADPAPQERSQQPVVAALVLLGLAALVAAAVYRGGGSSDLVLVPGTVSQAASSGSDRPTTL